MTDKSFLSFQVTQWRPCRVKLTMYYIAVMKILFTFISLVLLAACAKEKKAGQEILALREMSELATVEYTVTKLVKANDNKTWYTIGDRKILMQCEAHLKAGIDLSEIKEEDIRANGKKIELTLPEAKLVSLNIPPDSIKEAYQHDGALRQNFSAEEKNEMLRQAETQIRESVDSLGILRTAESNASLYISKFLRQLGYEEINIRFGNGAAAKNPLQ